MCQKTVKIKHNEIGKKNWIVFMRTTSIESKQIFPDQERNTKVKTNQKLKDYYCKENS